MKHEKEVFIVGNAFSDSFYFFGKDAVINVKKNGGIYNVDNIGYLIATDYNGAYFITNKYGTESKVVWSDKWETKLYEEYFIEKEKKNKMAYWIHFCYANTIPELKIQNFPANHKSCDISNITRNNCDINEEGLKSCDIVFISEESKDLERVKSICENYLICHTPNGSVLYNDGKFISSVFGVKHHQRYKFTVGAGDKFAGFVIEEFIKNNNILIAIETAHFKVEDWLKEINEKV